MKYSQVAFAALVAILLSGCASPTAPTLEPSAPSNGILINSEGQLIFI